MCHYITAVLPGQADVPRLDALARMHHRQFELLANPSIEARLRPAERYYFTTLGHCDCGAALGAGARVTAHQGSGRDSDTRQLRAKGWSETKIARWLAQKEKVSARDERVRSSQEIPGTEEWVAFLTAILHSKLTPYVGLLLHTYSGPLSERIHLTGRQVVPLEELTADMLSAVSEDVLYEFRAAVL